MANIKDYSKRKERLAPGHRLCPGCGASIIARQVMLATDNPIVVSNATGCLEVSTTIFPFTAWRVPWMHNAFENVAANITGIETAFRSLKKQGKIKKDIKFVAFGGDGGTYDIGLQALSGAVERGHNFVYVCYDNEAYMNTGVQRSGATPTSANTTTDPVGKARLGKQEFPKDLTQIMAAHHIPYVAQATISNLPDLYKKLEKAFNCNGPAFLNILSPCMPGWGVADDSAVAISKLALETNFWPLYEVENDVWTLNFDPGERKKPIIEWLRPQGRFKHLLKPENAAVIERIQIETDRRFELLKKKCAK